MVIHGHCWGRSRFGWGRCFLLGSYAESPSRCSFIIQNIYSFSYLLVSLQVRQPLAHQQGSPHWRYHHLLLPTMRSECWQAPFRHLEATHIVSNTSKIQLIFFISYIQEFVRGHHRPGLQRQFEPCLSPVPKVRRPPKSSRLYIYPQQNYFLVIQDVSKPCTVIRTFLNLPFVNSTLCHGRAHGRKVELWNGGRDLWRVEAMEA